MFKRIVVGCDGSPEGKDAVVLGVKLAEATGAGLSVVGVFPTTLFPVRGMSDRQSLRTRTEKMLHDTCSELAPGAMIHAAADFSVARALRHYAEHWHSDLVVVGSDPDTAPGHAAISRRGRQLLAGAPFAVAVAEKGLHERAVTLRSVGVGYDGGPEAEAALLLAAAIARGADCTLEVFSVVEDQIPVLTFQNWIAVDDTSDLLEHERETALADAERVAAKLNVRSTVSAVVGDPGLRIRRLSASVDLVVVGSRRWGPLAHLVSGSVGETLVHDAACSILIVPRPSDQGEHRTATKGAEHVTA